MKRTTVSYSFKDDLLRFVSSEILNEPSEYKLKTEDDLLTTELVDSMGVMRLVEFIENNSGVKVPAEDITIENFLTIDSIGNYVAQRKQNDGELEQS